VIAVAVLLLALVLVAALLTLGVVGPDHRLTVKCVLLGSHSLTTADIKDFHRDPEQEALALQCASRRAVDQQMPR
jgi:hypothetical protein